MHSGRRLVMSDSPANHATPSAIRKMTGFWLGVALFAGFLLWPTPDGMSTEAKHMAATVVLMACWWIGESLPLGVTALLPLAAYPLLKIMPYNEVAPHYTTHFVFFLLGGFFIALSMQKWELHTRIALGIIKVVGTSARRLVLGFMVATGFLSMWISDSATAMMMMPIGLGLIMKMFISKKGHLCGLSSL
jgi:sodium-dependent dicarboxylate transporter 2/3/5